MNEAIPTNLSPIETASIPRPAQRVMEFKTRQFTELEAVDMDRLEGAFQWLHEDGTITYVAIDRKTYPTDGETEKLIYLVDLGTDHQIIGYGEIRYNPDSTEPFFYHKPFEGFTRTDEAYQRRGYGRRRVITMGRLSQAIFGLPLNSDTLMSDEARHIWQKLARQGLAVAYQEGQRIRYRLELPD